MVVNLLERKWSANYHLLNVEGNLLILVYVHNIFLAFCLHLALPLVMPCTLVHSFALFGNTYKTQPPTFQIYKLDGFHKILSPFGYGIMKCKTKLINDINIILFSIGLNGLAKNAYMSIEIRSCNVNGGRVRISYSMEDLVL